MPQTTGRQYQTADHRPQTTDRRPQRLDVGKGLKTQDERPEAPNNRRRVGGGRRPGAIELRKLPALRYRVEYSSEVIGHLRVLTTRQQVTVLGQVDTQLAHQPHVETRNRKPMRPNPVAPWELRIGEFRVYYQVRDNPERIVQVLAVGIKRRDQVWIGGRAVER